MFRSLSVIYLFILIGCSDFLSWRYLPATDEQKEYIHVVNHGWHTGIVIAADSIGPELAFLNKYFKDARYYEFGWGDEKFYRAGEITLRLAAGAILWPTTSVMHVVALPAPPAEYFVGSEVSKITISRQGHEYLNSALYNSFQQGDNGRPLAKGEGLYGDSRFFAGRGYYFLTRTCNRWTARSLYRAGIPISPVLTVTASGVMEQINAALGKSGYET